MSLELHEMDGGKILALNLSGKLHREDYERFVPEVERLIKRHGKVRVLVQMHDFHGWDMGGIWEDIKFDLRHFNDIERVALVGESSWEKGMAWFCKPFTTAAVRYFDTTQAEEARQWIQTDLAKA